MRSQSVNAQCNLVFGRGVLLLIVVSSVFIFVITILITLYPKLLMVTGKKTLPKQVIRKFMKNGLVSKVISCHKFSERQLFSIKPNS